VTETDACEQITYSHYMKMEWPLNCKYIGR